MHSLLVVDSHLDVPSTDSPVSETCIKEKLARFILIVLVALMLAESEAPHRVSESSRVWNLHVCLRQGLCLTRALETTKFLHFV
jgi:hypothetical protein